MPSLKPVTINNHEALFKLMQRIYPPAYKQLWLNEDCSWYIHSQYNFEQLKKELQDTNAEYYFIMDAKKDIGILRLIHQKEKATTKLHRLYLDQNYQGQGMGQKLMLIIEAFAKVNNSKSIWLEAMDTQIQALQFYKKQGFTIVQTYQLPFKLIHQKLRGIHKMTKQL
ncbi:GNAT family N-acetyltransferase [Olleya sp. R77988]|uniref:GNAT family N-acetyltransferase n=1 Tax=Olleya sp. R77988 TaxID=3093875 RepID=UPI0037CC71B2